MSQKREINCIYAKGEKCYHPLVKNHWLFFRPYCVRSNKFKGFRRCTLQKFKDERYR